MPRKVIDPGPFRFKEILSSGDKALILIDGRHRAFAAAHAGGAGQHRTAAGLISGASWRQ